MHASIFCGGCCVDNGTGDKVKRRVLILSQMVPLSQPPQRPHFFIFSLPDEVPWENYFVVRMIFVKAAFLSYSKRGQ